MKNKKDSSPIIIIIKNMKSDSDGNNKDQDRKHLKQKLPSVHSKLCYLSQNHLFPI